MISLARVWILTIAVLVQLVAVALLDAYGIHAVLPYVLVWLTLTGTFIAVFAEVMGVRIPVDWRRR